MTRLVFGGSPLTFMKGITMIVINKRFPMAQQYITKSTSEKQVLVSAEVLTGMIYIGQHSGQDKPLRDALEALRTNAPTGKNGKVSSATAALVGCIGTALVSAKVSYSKHQQDNRLDDSSMAAFVADCEGYLADFSLAAFGDPVEKAAKAAATKAAKDAAKVSQPAPSEGASLEVDSLRQQLATVTAERDALRATLNRIQEARTIKDVRTLLAA